MPTPGMSNKPEASISTGFGGGNSAAEAFRSSEAQKMGGVSTFTSPGGKLTQAQFNKVTGKSETNPYGLTGPTAFGRFLNRFFGPENLDYTNTVPGGKAGIAQLNALALDVFNNPYAEQNIFGQPTGANAELGIARSGVQPGQYTSMGTAKSYRADLSPMGRMAAGLASISIPFGSGYAISEGTKVTGIEDNVPISARTGEPLSEAGTGALSFLGDIMTGGQSQYATGKTKSMIDNMMSFFKGDQEVTNIQPSDVSTGMSAYSETGRPISGVPQLGVTSYGSPMAQITAPATAAPTYGSPMAQVTAAQATPDELSFGVEPFSSSSSALNVDAFNSLMNETLAPNQATAPKSSLTMKSVPSDFNTLYLESAYLSGKLTPEAQAGIAAELQKRAERGDAMAQSSLTMIGYKEPTPVPPARPGRFLGSMGQPLNIIPSSFDTLGNPAL